MRHRHTRWSAGTVAMILITAVVLCCTAAVIVLIRGGSGVLSGDVERISGSIASLVDSLQPGGTQRVTVGGTTPAQQTPAPTQALSIAASPAIITARPTAECRTVTLTIGGLFQPSQKIYNGITSEKGTVASPEMLFSGIADALFADVNLALVDASSYSADGAWWTTALKSAGFDGAVPLSGTQQAMQAALSAAGLRADGAGQEGYTLRAVNGMTLALIACTEKASDAASWSTVFEAESFARTVAAARAHGAQAVVACIRWKDSAGIEATEAQHSIVQAMADAGADIVIGAKTGLVWPVEILHRADGGRTLVAWSMGTLLADNRESRAAVSACLLHISISYDIGAQALDFLRVEYTPCYIWGQSQNGVFRYRVLQSAVAAPESMNQSQREYMGRALKLIQETMSAGIATQR